MDHGGGGRGLPQARHHAPSRPGATRSSAIGARRSRRASCTATACASPGFAAAACFRPADPRGPRGRDRRQPPRHRRGGGARRRLPRARRRRPAEGLADIAAAREMVADGIAALLPHARAAKMPLAIEPLHPMYAADRACVNTLEQALDICDLLGEGVGVAIDVYHVWWDPKLARRSPAPAPTGRSSPTTSATGWCRRRDLLLDRGMMGDGVIDLTGIRAAIEAAGYHRPAGGRDLFGRELVEAARRRGACDLRRALSDGVLNVRPRTHRGGRRGFASPRLRGEGSAFGRTSGAKRSGGEGAVPEEARCLPAAPSSSPPPHPRPLRRLAAFGSPLPASGERWSARRSSRSGNR